MQKANKNDVRKEIADLITRIKEQSDRIGMQRDIPQKELDLILYRIEELYKKTVVWAYLNELPVESEGVQVSLPGLQTPELNVTFPQPHNPPVQLPVSDPNATGVTFPSSGKVDKEETTAREIKVDEVPVLKATPKEVATNVNETVQPKSGPVVSDKAENQKPAAVSLKDVRTFIGINEKIMYIRQVFKGNDIAYNTAIEKFNNMNSWSEAQSYLSVLADEYKWGKHDEPVEIFTQTVKRRFS